jgi:exosome complex protein LRP1
MDSSDVKELVEDMTASIDDLEASLAPLLNASLSASTSKLPLLDKAKLYVLATYAIDSVLFSYLRLNGQNVKDHPVVQEIMRVRSYFNKIKEVEAGPVQRNATLDKDAAARFIKHGLAGNDKYDQARQDRKAVEASAKRKAEEFEASARFGSQNRFAGMAKRMKAEEPTITVVKADDASSDDEAAADSKAEKKAAKQQRRAEAKQDSEAQGEETSAASTRPSRKSKTAPRSNHETFQALLNGPVPKKEKKKRKSKGEAQQ